jgi:hypothetical protein
VVRRSGCPLPLSWWITHPLCSLMSRQGRKEKPVFKIVNDLGLCAWRAFFRTFIFYSTWFLACLHVTVVCWIHEQCGL